MYSYVPLFTVMYRLLSSRYVPLFSGCQNLHHVLDFFGRVPSDIALRDNIWAAILCRHLGRGASFQCLPELSEVGGVARVLA